MNIQELLKDYDFTGKDIDGRFEFRSILPEESDMAVDMEKRCFPPAEACSKKMLKDRINAASDLFMVAFEKSTGILAGSVCGISTDENSFKDEFFSDADLYNPDGKNIMLLGLEVLPEYRGQGLARELMFQYLRKERDRNRQTVIPTCLQIGRAHV